MGIMARRRQANRFEHKVVAGAVELPKQNPVIEEKQSEPVIQEQQEEVEEKKLYVPKNKRKGSQLPETDDEE